MVVWIFVLGDDMFRVILLGFLVFTVSCVVVPTSSYAISLDDDEEDAEDVADLLNQAKKAGESESFDKADELLKKAKMYGVKADEVKEVSNYIAKKKQEKKARLERQRKERERLARLKREREERERQARVSSSSSGSYSGSISMCYPNIPRPIEYSECSGAKTASGKYATVQLKRGGVSLTGGANCFDLTIYANGSIANGNTCGGANGSWSVIVNGQSGVANGLGNAIAWLLRRM